MCDAASCPEPSGMMRRLPFPPAASLTATDVAHNVIRKNNNFKIALATSAAKERALKQLKQADIEKFFDVIISRDDVKETKPNPEIFLKAAEKLNVLPSECIVIEDSSAGIRAAFNARMIAIHVVDLKEADEDILNHCYNS